MLPARLRTFCLALALGLAGVAAAAQSIEDSVVSQLRQQGYVEFQVSRTLLGRLHIVAISAEFRREIVINPNNGEILRDYITALSGGGTGPLVVIPDRRFDDDDDDDSGGGGNDDDDDTGGGGGGGGNDDDDDDDDRGNDDDDDDDGGDDDDD